MRRLVPLASLILLASSVLTYSGAQTQPAPAQKNVRSKEALVFEALRTEVRFEKDGTGTTHVSAGVLVQSESAVQQFGLLSLAYIKTNEDLTVEYVRVRKPDGRLVTTPPEDFQDMASEVTRLAPMYSDLREVHIPIRGLAIGDRLEYAVRTRLHTSLIPNQFGFAYNFFKTGTMLDEELDVNVPADIPVKVKSADVQPTVRTEGERRIYTWKASHEGEGAEETDPLADAPPPPVEIGSFQTWEEVGRWWEPLEEERAVVTPEIRAKALELTKGTTTDEEKVRAVYKYVATQFRYISLSFGIGRYQPHAALDVLDNAYGDCKDKHTLLEALLKAVGIQAYPALINSSRKVEPDVPSPAQFDHVISVVPLGDRTVWLDTTTEVAPFGFLMVNLRDKQALVMPPGKPASLVTTPAEPPFQMTDRWQIDGKLGSEGVLDAKITRAVRGDL
ncbi:MAG: transglutaminase, partial [Acidobacteria bacterium]